MLENTMNALGEENEHDGFNFVGSKVVYSTLQKLIANSYFVKNK